jgi:tripartite-type tricarboxylate transporter receptor subunit TctC
MLAAGAALPLGGRIAGALSFPGRPVRIVVPFAAGTAPDLIARLLAEQLQPRWSQPVVVENRTGASGNVAAEHVARSEGDGHTLLLSPPPPLSINRFLFKSMPFQPADLAMVTVVASAPNVLVANPSVPASDLNDFIRLARTVPEKLSYASTGKGGTPHLTMEWLRTATQVELVHVPYSRGLAPALKDLLGGHVQLMFANLSDARPHVEAGRLKALAVTSAEPVGSLPGVAPAARVVPGLVAETWYGIATADATPAPTVARIAADVGAILASPAAGERLRAMSLTPVGNSPADAAAFVDSDARRWQGVIEMIGLKPE